jgi:hypothetical protein
LFELEAFTRAAQQLGIQQSSVSVSRKVSALQLRFDPPFPRSLPTREDRSLVDETEQIAKWIFDIERALTPRARDNLPCALAMHLALRKTAKFPRSGMDFQPRCFGAIRRFEIGLPSSFSC